MEMEEDELWKTAWGGTEYLYGVSLLWQWVPMEYLVKTEAQPRPYVVLEDRMSAFVDKTRHVGVAEENSNLN